MKHAQNKWHYTQAVVMAPAEGPLGVRLVEKGELGTQTEAEKHLKRMLDKQLETKLTVKEHFKKHLKFTKSSSYTTIAEVMSGIHSLEEFSETEKAKEMYEELQRSGLTEEEIILYIAYKMGKESNRKIEPKILNAKIELIEEKLKQRQEKLCKPQQLTGVKTLSRHEMDIEKTLYAGCDSKNEFSSLIVNHSSPSFSGGCNDPYMHIKNLSEKLTKGCHKRKRRKSESSNEDDDGANVSEFQLDPNIHHAVIPLETKEIEQNRLTLEEIRSCQNGRFKDYSPGNPSKVLYVKNLHRKVTISELIALFGGFESDGEEPIKYELCGKSYKQAFIKFTDAEVAKRALNMVNGYKIRGRPAIIEFGRNKDET